MQKLKSTGASTGACVTTGPGATACKSRGLKSAQEGLAFGTGFLHRSVRVILSKPGEGIGDLRLGSTVSLPVNKFPSAVAMEWFYCAQFWMNIRAWLSKTLPLETSSWLEVGYYIITYVCVPAITLLREMKKWKDSHSYLKSCPVRGTQCDESVLSHALWCLPALEKRGLWQVNTSMLSST